MLGATDENTLRQIMGSAWHTNMRALVRKEYAGNPTNNVVPDYDGQVCRDTANDDWYIAHGLTSADWKIFAT